MKVADFCSQLDVGDGDDNNEGGNGIVDKDNYAIDEDDGQVEGLLKVARAEAQLQAQQLVRAGLGRWTSPPHPPKARWGGDDGIGGVRGDEHQEGKGGEDNNDNEFNYGKNVTT